MRPITATSGSATQAAEPDVVIEATGVASVVFDALAATALAGADLDWLDRLITRRVPLDRAGDAGGRGRTTSPPDCQP